MSQALLSTGPRGSIGLWDRIGLFFDKFESYATYDEAFTSKTDYVDGPELYNAFAETLSKMGAAMLSFLFDVFSGGRDKDLESLCKSHQGPPGMIRWSELSGDTGKTMFRRLVVAV